MWHSEPRKGRNAPVQSMCWLPLNPGLPEDRQDTVHVKSSPREGPLIP